MAQQLKATLDLPRQRAHLATLGCDVPIAVITGHLALDIAAFSRHAHELTRWSELAGMNDEADCDPEIFVYFFS